MRWRSSTLNGLQFRHHAFLRRFPPDGERSIAPALPAKMREAQKRKGFRLPFSTPLPVLGGEPPKLDQSCFLRMQLQPEFRQAFPKSLQELLGFRSVFEAYDQGIGLTDDDYVTLATFRRQASIHRSKRLVGTGLVGGSPCGALRS